MFTTSEQCPLCHATVTDWSARCPKCRYHPDCDDRDCYNRAQDDVALLARYSTTERAAPAAPRAATADGHSWRRLVPGWLRRPGFASA